MAVSRKDIHCRTHTWSLFLDVDHSLRIPGTLIIPKNVEEGRSERFLIHCILLLIVITIILFWRILIIFIFSIWTHILYTFGITFGLRSVFGKFSFSHLAFYWLSCHWGNFDLTSRLLGDLSPESLLTFYWSLKGSFSKYPFFRIFCSLVLRHL